MTLQRFTSSKPDHWIAPRAHTDAGLRQHHYGKIEPMADERRAQWRKDRWLVPLVALLLLVLVTVGSETGRAILMGVPV